VAAGLERAARELRLAIDHQGAAMRLAWNGQAPDHAEPAAWQRALQALAARGWRPDYLTLRRRADLQAPQAGDTGQSLVVLGAARLGTTRLIDNFEV